jgi:hypothetical protein
MNKQITKAQIFWGPTLETARNIDDSDTVLAIEAVRHRFSASMRDLENAFDAKASELHAAFVKEVSEHVGSDASPFDLGGVAPANPKRQETLLQREEPMTAKLTDRERRRRKRAMRIAREAARYAAQVAFFAASIRKKHTVDQFPGIIATLQPWQPKRFIGDLRRALYS